jgi:hypothetical protein
MGLFTIQQEQHVHHHPELPDPPVDAVNPLPIQDPAGEIGSDNGVGGFCSWEGTHLVIAAG